MTVSVIKKDISTNSTSLSAVLLAIDGQEGLTLPEAARLLGVAQRTLRSHCDRHGLDMGAISADNAQELRIAGIIPLRGRTPNFLPKETFRELVRLVGTAEARAIYNALWDVAEAVQSGEIGRAQELVGLDEDKALEHLEAALSLAKKFKAERDEARRTKAEINNKKTATAMATASVLSRKVASLEVRLGEAANVKSALAWKAEFPEFAPFTEGRLGRLLSDKARFLGEPIARIEHPYIPHGVGGYTRATALALAASI